MKRITIGRDARTIGWVIAAAVPGLWPSLCTEAMGAERMSSRSYLPAVRTFADNVLRYGRDIYGPEHTPLFADGLNIDTYEPAVWRLSREHVEAWKMPPQWVLSNLASQQNLLRVLVALTALTGDPKYKQAAVEVIRHAFGRLRHDSGLLYWGGHAAWDLATDQPVGEGRTGAIAGKHELKSHYPFYELMWEVDAPATRKFIESVWASHVLRWDILDMNRHGPYLAASDNLWDQAYVGGPVPFAGKGLTFMSTGSDLIYAGAMLYHLSEDQRPLIWAKRMGERYDDVRHPQTGLGADNYSTLTPDRMQQQFGAEFGDRFTEASVTSLYGNRYTRVAVCQMKLYEILGDPGRDFLMNAVRDLRAYATHAYDPADNSFSATLIDGTRLSPSDRKRDGYVVERWLQKRPPAGIHFWAYALAYRLTGQELMWDMVRAIGAGKELGEIGPAPRGPPSLNMKTSAADADLVFGLLELHRQTGSRDYLSLAARISDNLLEKTFHKGFFVAGKNHVFCRFDTTVPLALLYLEVALRDLPVRLPPYCAGHSYFHCSFDGLGRTYDDEAIYTRLRGPSPSTTPSAGR